MKKIIITLFIVLGSFSSLAANVFYAYVNKDTEKLVLINNDSSKIDENHEVLIISKNGVSIGTKKNETKCWSNSDDNPPFCDSIFVKNDTVRNSTWGIYDNVVFGALTLGFGPASKGFSYQVVPDHDKLDKFAKENNLYNVIPNYGKQQEFNKKYELVANDIKLVPLNDVDFESKLNEQGAELDKKLAVFVAEKERLAMIEKERLAKIAAEKERLAKIEQDKLNATALKECKSVDLKKKEQTLDECIESFKKEALVKKELDDSMKKEKERLAKLVENKEYFELNEKVVNMTIKDEFGDTTMSEQCAIVIAYKKRFSLNDKNSELIKMYSQVFQKNLVEMLDKPEYWYTRNGAIQGQIPPFINRGLVPSSVEINSMNIQNKEKNVKVNASIYSILGYVNKYLNDHANANMQTTRNRMMLFYSFLIAEGGASHPVKNSGVFGKCKMGIDMFVDHGVDFVNLLADKNMPAVKLLSVLMEANHSETTKYLLSDSRTKKIFEEMKSYKW